MFQFKTVDNCSCIPWSVIEYKLPVVFPYSCDTCAKGAKNVRIDYARNLFGRECLKNGRPEFEFEEAAHKEMVVCFNVLLTESAQWRDGHAGILGML
ncbi:hypothetical protein BCV72DRAFT_308313 [Rhizopus microsporus var. microsporus]|uniref:Uncharacterized protein n=1 Tax=Rhizopus microsporus var. microsporus TaxID=86635 RepID=A0A1X0QU97_RHIZD|nr:hypothetical protein BCV72DRAFT_308313 [Rhizopus microsporus var. microsporus]